jgi:hypothetical protein
VQFHDNYNDYPAPRLSGRMVVPGEIPASEVCSLRSFFYPPILANLHEYFSRLAGIREDWRILDHLHKRSFGWVFIHFFFVTFVFFVVDLFIFF